jgi:phytoene dehydrogenase-like protein
VARSFPDHPWTAAGLIYPLDKPVVFGGLEFNSLRPMIYNFDPTLAPPGKTFVRLYLPADYEYWNALRDKPDEYRAEKERIAETAIDLLDRRYPGFASQVEVWDVATPLTFERYTGNWKGASMGWGVTTKTFNLSFPKTLPGLRNFFMAGQWAGSGGIPMVAVSGRHVIQLMCKRDKIAFISSEP